MPSRNSGPLPISRLHAIATLAKLLVFLFIPKAFAQPQPDPHVLQATLVGAPINLSTTWLFHPEDGNDYSALAIDDHAWPVISSTQPFSAYAPAGSAGGWYRVHVHLPANEPALTLSVERFRGSFRAYANGISLGGFGRMAGAGDDLQARFANFPLPAQLAGSPELVIVLHGIVRHIQAFEPDNRVGLWTNSSVRLGLLETFQREQSLYQTQYRLEDAVVLTAWAAVLLLAGGLFLVLRVQPEYLAVAIEAAALLTWNLVLLYTQEHNIPYSHPLSVALLPLRAVQFIAELEFIRLIAGVRRTRWVIFVESLALLQALIQIATEALLLPVAWNPAAWNPAIAILFAFALAIAELSLLIMGARRRNRDALLLLPSYALFAFTDLWFRIVQLWDLIKLPGHLQYLPSGDLPLLSLSLHDLENGFLILSILTVLIARTLRIVRKHSETAAEIKAARVMQQMLLARASAPTPGFTVDSVYHPASEVGGDFFLVSPGPDRSLTAIVGDVSGKGLPAAMRVAMILGILRREESHDPATIMNGLNRALLNEPGGGFTTACCVQLNHDGSYTVVNAGHIAPYVTALHSSAQASEITTPGALPLGLTGDSAYESIAGLLNAGQRMVLMSDGVVEARSKSGELYGFERLSNLLHHSASDIAAAAQSFGQDDDITVLSIACA